MLKNINADPHLKKYLQKTELSLSLSWPCRRAPSLHELSLSRAGGEGRATFSGELRLSSADLVLFLQSGKGEIRNRWNNYLSKEVLIWPACQAFFPCSQWVGGSEYLNSADDVESKLFTLIIAPSMGIVGKSLWGLHKHPLLGRSIMAELLGAVTTATKFFFEVKVPIINHPMYQVLWTPPA